MAIILIHLRRLILLFTFIYLTGSLLGRLLAGARHSRIRNLMRPKRVHLQIWFYIYTFYGYVIITNYFGLNQMRSFNILSQE